jgi:hypothetical protein
MRNSAAKTAGWRRKSVLSTCLPIGAYHWGMPGIPLGQPKPKSDALVVAEALAREDLDGEEEEEEEEEEDKEEDEDDENEDEGYSE